MTCRRPGARIDGRRQGPRAKQRVLFRRHYNMAMRMGCQGRSTAAATSRLTTTSAIARKLLRRLYSRTLLYSGASRHLLLTLRRDLPKCGRESTAGVTVVEGSSLYVGFLHGQYVPHGAHARRLTLAWRTSLMSKPRAATAVTTMTEQVPGCCHEFCLESTTTTTDSWGCGAGDNPMLHRQSLAGATPMVQPALPGTTKVQDDKNNGAGTVASYDPW
ncbi:hypothetical protein MRX96_005171 [Rhipicephalus microplus]